MTAGLKELAESLNISTHYSYFCGGTYRHCEASDDLLRFLIEDMGYQARSSEDIEKSLARIEKKRWQRITEAIYVCREGDVSFDIVSSEDEAKKEIEVFAVKEGQKKEIKLDVDFEIIEKHSDGRRLYVRMKGRVITSLVPEYYNLRVCIGDKEYHTMLAVAPQKCYVPESVNKGKLFGFAVQLYSLISKRNWGVGDFTDLGNLVTITADCGGDVIGLNPLNVLLFDYPESASPYASISRLFLNPIYIDVEKVPFYSDKDKDVEAVEQAKASENIDYSVVFGAKVKALRSCYARFLKKKDSKYAQEFEEFKNKEGSELHRLAVFQAIQHERFLRGGRLSDKEEKELALAMGHAVEKFGEMHKEEVEFFKFLQFEADRQLREVAKKIKKSKMAIGLYRDLPVGVSKNSAEVWGDKYLYIQKSGAGVPPDAYFPTGQKWGLGAFNPFELKERCYKPFIRILRANMRYSGAIRIDHIMGLSRLFIIPDDGTEGTYIRYNAQDMMNILALESYLNKCMVVGECIGNVEAGYAESLLERGIYLLGVLWSERKDDSGTMKTPEEYEEKYFASVGTHDMPPLKAWWFGREIATMQRLGFYDTKETESAYHWRENERRLLLNALDSAGVWPEDNYRHGDYLYGENYPEGIEEAVHAYMAKSNSKVFLLMPEDVFRSERIQNLPGTDVDKYPNWRAKQNVALEDYAGSDIFKRHIAIMKKWRV